MQVVEIKKIEGGVWGCEERHQFIEHLLTFHFRAPFKLGRHVFLRSGAKTQNGQSKVGFSVQ